MKEFKVDFIKNGLKYTAPIKAQTKEEAILIVEGFFLSEPDYEAQFPQNVVLNICEVKEEN